MCSVANFPDAPPAGMADDSEIGPFGGPRKGCVKILESQGGHREGG